MNTSGAFKHEQRGVALSMAAALMTTIVVVGAVALETRTGAAEPYLARLQFAVRADLLVIGWLAAAIANVARLRFFSASDIAGSSAEAASDPVRIAGAVLENTFEQSFLAVTAHLILAATFGRSGAIIAALVCLFAVGRLLFWIGYRRGATGRAFGFALTFYPSVLALLAAGAATLFGLAG